MEDIGDIGVLEQVHHQKINQIQISAWKKIITYHLIIKQTAKLLKISLGILQMIC